MARVLTAGRHRHHDGYEQVNGKEIGHGAI